MEEDWRARCEREENERAARREIRRKEREAFRQKLFDTPDELAWQAPPPLEDFNALLAEHAAQLRNAVRQTMGFALADDNDCKANASAASALTRLIQTNIAIAKVLGVGDETSKTVRGGPEPKDAQD